MLLRLKLKAAYWFLGSLPGSFLCVGSPYSAKHPVQPGGHLHNPSDVPATNLLEHSVADVLFTPVSLHVLADAPRTENVYGHPA